MTSLVPILTLILTVAVKVAIIIAIVYFFVKKTNLIAGKEEYTNVTALVHKLLDVIGLRKKVLK